VNETVTEEPNSWLDTLIESATSDGNRWLRSPEAKAIANTFPKFESATCIHCYLSVIAVERTFRGGFMRSVEWIAVSLNLIMWMLWPLVPLRNITVGVAQVAIAHHPRLRPDSWLGEKWFAPDCHSLKERAKLAWEVVRRTDWQMSAVDNVLEGLTCRRSSINEVAIALARQYNPGDPTYPQLLRGQLRLALELYPNIGCRSGELGLSATDCPGFDGSSTRWTIKSQ
jgi:hypothetical protein